MSKDYSEDKLIEQPCMDIFQELSWETADVFKGETFGEHGTLGRDSKADVILKTRFYKAVKKLNPNLQRLLNFKPTNASTYAAMTGGYSVAGPATASGLKGNWKTFLDMVASVESESHGGYDAYNLGGSSGGHVAHGSGNSNDGRFGKPLSHQRL